MPEQRDCCDVRDLLATPCRAPHTACNLSSPSSSDCGLVVDSEHSKHTEQSRQPEHFDLPVRSKACGMQTTRAGGSTLSAELCNFLALQRALLQKRAAAAAAGPLRRRLTQQAAEAGARLLHVRTVCMGAQAAAALERSRGA